MPAADWESSGQRPRLGLSFFLKPGLRQAGSGLPTWFENLLPDPGSALRTRLTRLHELSPYDALGLLAALGRDLPGAVQVIPGVAEEVGDLSAPGETSAPATVTGDDRFRFSLAGMQLKLSMAAQGQRFAITSTNNLGHWIVKLPDLRHLDLPDIEAATMRWAKAAGHDVPVNFAFNADRIDGLPAGWADGIPRAYAIERFDRLPTGLRVHHEDFCQALDVLPDHKYGDSGNPRYSLDGVLRMVADAAGEEEAKKFALRVGFVIASGNTDAHLKNWSLQWGGADRPALSPCYDQVATVTWPERYGWSLRGGPKLGLGLGRVRRFLDLDSEALQCHADKSGQRWAREVIIAGIEQARDAWPAIEEECPDTMRCALRRHWRKVPVLISAGGLIWKPPASYCIPSARGQEPEAANVALEKEEAPAALQAAPETLDELGDESRQAP